MNDRNLLKGLFLIVFALIFGVGAWLNYPLGRVERAGPGFFPLMVSSIVLVLGLAIVVRSRLSEPVPMYFNLRNIAIIMASLVGFAVLAHFVNMTAAIIFLVFSSAFAGTSYSIRRNIIISVVLLGIAIAFQKGLGLQLPLY